MRAMCGRVMRDGRLQTLEPDGDQAIAQFRDIVIQDGSSFAVKRALKDVFPTRFTTTGPAAVELHATYRGYADDVTAIHLAPDCDAERQLLPEPRSLAGQAYTPAAGGTFGTLTSTVGRTVGLGANRQVQFAVRLNFCQRFRDSVRPGTRAGALRPVATDVGGRPFVRLATRLESESLARRGPPIGGTGSDRDFTRPSRSFHPRGSRM